MTCIPDLFKSKRNGMHFLCPKGYSRSDKLSGSGITKDFQIVNILITFYLYIDIFIFWCYHDHIVNRPFVPIFLLEKEERGHKINHVEDGHA